MTGCPRGNSTVRGIKVGSICSSCTLASCVSSCSTMASQEGSCSTVTSVPGSGCCVTGALTGCVNRSSALLSKVCSCG